MPRRIAALVLLFAASLLVACAGSAWRQARSEDSISAYHQFLKDYPESSFSQEARARLEMARIRKKPTREAYESFRTKFPDPVLVAELMPHIEESYFRHARAVGSPVAYREFLEQFSDGTLAARAEGNLAYLEAGGFGGDVQALADFAKRHPQSDNAAEARRSIEIVSARASSRFQRVGLLLDVDPTTPGRDRVWRVLRDRVVGAYSAAGLEVVILKDPKQSAESGVGALLTIQHEERELPTTLEGTQLSQPSIQARTRVRLERPGDPTPIWSDSFEFRAPVSAGREDLSILFSPGSQASYWAAIDGQFFVPIARWSTQLAARDPVALAKPVVAVDVAGNRAVTLFGDGDFQVYDLGDPAQPVRLGQYERKRDLATFDGVAVAGSRVAIFGPDGIEIVFLDGEATQREAVFGRDVVGSVVALERLGHGWIAATNRGLLRLEDGSSAVRTLVSRPILGLALEGERLLFTDGASLFAAHLALLQAGRVEAELRLGRGFRPGVVRVHAGTAIVLGERDAVWIDVRAAQPRLLSRIGGSEAGRVRDAAIVGNRIFLLGPRGLQVADGSGERIVDSVDVAARDRIGVAGRHLVLVGQKSLQVVDATPFVASVPASRRD